VGLDVGRAVGVNVVVGGAGELLGAFVTGEPVGDAVKL